MHKGEYTNEQIDNALELVKDDLDEDTCSIWTCPYCQFQQSDCELLSYMQKESGNEDTMLEHIKEKHLFALLQDYPPEEEEDG